MLSPDVTVPELLEILESAVTGQDVPDIDSPTQMEVWRAERECEAE